MSARRKIAIPADVRSMSLGSIPVLTAIAIQNVSNLVFHVVVSRSIGPSAYGSLAALLAVLFVISVPVGVVQTVAAKQTTLVRSEVMPTDGRLMLAELTKSFAVLGFAVATVLAACAPLLARFLEMDLKSVLLISPYFFVVLIGSIGLGALQGRLRFGNLAVAVIAGVLVRLILGVVLTSLGFGVAGAMLATVIGPIATAVIAFAVLRLTPAMGVRARTSFAMIKREFRPALAALGTFAVLAQLDIALARHYLPSKTAGLYSGAGLLARAPLYVSSAIALVAFPRFVALKEDEDQARRWLHLSLVSTVAICVPTSMAIVVLRRPIIDAVLGSQFVPAAVFVPILALAMTVMAAVSLLTYFHVAVETLAYRVLLGGLFLETGAIVLFHRSGSEIAAIVFLAGSASVALLYHAAHAALVRPSREQQPAPARNPILDLSIVLPCHNSGDTISELLAELLNQTAALGAYSFEIIVVSDGSSDDTVTRARAFEPTVRVIERARRQGKGSALRVGLSETLGRYIVYMDSDGDISPDALGPFLALMELYGPDIILGSKRHPMSVVSYPPLRRLMSWTYHHVTRVLFGVKVRDTQTGLKMIRREVLDAVLPRVLEKRYAFDLEFLVVARLLGFTRTFEAPITLSYRFTSGVNARQTLFIIIDTLAIAYRRYILGTYHRSGRAQGLDTSQQETTDQVVAEVLAQAETHVLP